MKPTVPTPKPEGQDDVLYSENPTDATIQQGRSNRDFALELTTETHNICSPGVREGSGLLSFLRLPAGPQWTWQDDAGRLRIKVPAPYRDHGFPITAAIALALTDIGCKRGQGKVYYYYPHPLMNKQVEFFVAYISIGAVLDLFCKPEKWRGEDKAAWADLMPSQKAYRLDNRNGWVTKDSPLLPIAVSYNCDSDSEVVFDKLTTALITVCLNPSCLVAPTSALRRFCNRTMLLTTEKLTSNSLEMMFWTHFLSLFEAALSLDVDTIHYALGGACTG